MAILLSYKLSPYNHLNPNHEPVKLTILKKAFFGLIKYKVKCTKKVPLHSFKAHLDHFDNLIKNKTRL